MIVGRHADGRRKPALGIGEALLHPTALWIRCYAVPRCCDRGHAWSWTYGLLTLQLCYLPLLATLQDDIRVELVPEGERRKPQYVDIKV